MVPVELYCFVDQYGSNWTMPVSPHDKALGRVFKRARDYCKKVRKPDVWKAFYDFKNSYDPALSYNYATTVHKSQGSQWKHVYVDYDNIKFADKLGQTQSPRLLYTAASRMQEKVRYVKAGAEHYG